ncbi:MAG TPA: hypothetical protein VLT47_09975 [Anaeromyxobacteraceae bacterium]|nr:hypothetical protein [Anaeromyxobacteraceae bacterium]
MSDQRSVMKEYRLLEQKRLSGPLTPQEEARLSQLRDLVGADAGVSASKPGFDVNAAAARLRESLLPAGLRNRPAGMDAPPPPAAAPRMPEPEAAATPALGLEAVWNAAPFAPLTEPPAGGEEPLFDPGSLGADLLAGEAGWDPNAQPYDPSAQQGWDPNAQPYDPNAAAYDAGAQPYDAGAQGWDANAAAYDAGTQPYDAGAQGWDPNTPAYDAGAQPYDAGAQGWDPNAPAAYDAGAQPYDPNATQWDAATQPAWDPNLAAPWGEAQAEPTAEPYAPAEAGALAEQIVQPADGSWDLGAELAEPAPQPSPEGEAPAWEATAGAPEEAPPAADAAWDSGLVAPEAPGEPAPPVEAEAAPEASWDLEATPVEPPEPVQEPAGEPETLQPSEELLPFDAEATSSVGAGASPEGWDAESPPVEELSLEEAPSARAAEAASLGRYEEGDLSPEPAPQIEALPSEEAHGLLAPLGAGQELTSDDDAFAQGFQLESNGSFGGAPAGGAAWRPQEEAAPEGEAWESAPALDLATAGVTGSPEPSPGRSAPTGSLEELDVEEFPVVEGSELLEEIPEEVPAAPALAAETRVEGAHRVVVHTLEGLVKRGVITDAALDAGTLALAAQPDAVPEQLETARVKAIFFMLAPGEIAPTPEGKKVRVTFTDGRQIAGFSPDYSDAGAGFFMVPADTRTHTGRIWVYRAAVKDVAIS